MSEAERLTEILQSVIMESMEATLQSGERVPVGSDEHIQDLQTILRGMQHVRNQHPRASAKRATYAAACNRLAQQIRRLTRIRAKQDATPEIA